MTRRQRLLRILYSLVAFAGSWMLHNVQHGSIVLAQEYQAQQQFEHGRDWDRHDEKEKQIDAHFTATDAKVGEMAEKLSMISGIGVTVCAGLGILNLLGFIRPHAAAAGEPSGKTHFITPE